MIPEDQLNSLKKTARIAGILVLVIAVFAPFSMLYVPSTLIVPGDAATTASSIRASEGLLRAGIASDALVFLLEIVLVVFLYMLLKPVDRTLSLVAAFARLAMAVVQGVNVFHYFLGPAAFERRRLPDRLRTDPAASPSLAVPERA